MKWHLLWPVVCLMLFVFSTNSAVLHVDPNGTNATLPYSNWSIAATNIQDAIDAASNGDLVLVSNGVYNAGVRTIGSYGGSRIAITKPIEVASVNGPTVTIIDSFGQVAVRCAYLTNGASLVGFTLTNGASFPIGGVTFPGGGGAFCESTNAFLTNCIIDRCFDETDGGGGVYSGTLYGCVLANNSVEGGLGGGAYLSSLINCTLVNNSNAWFGGGAANCFLTHCVLSNNQSSFGGAALSCTLSDCLIIRNHRTPRVIGSGSCGGGVCGGALTNCTLVDNSSIYGGGAYAGVVTDNVRFNSTNPIVLDHCIISNNMASYGGGVLEMLTQGFDLTNCILNNCVITGNTATNVGGGIVGGTLSQCLISSNRVTSAYTAWYNEGITGIGGGAEEASLNNCVLIGNTAAVGSALDVSGYYSDHLIRCSSTNVTIAGNISTNGAAVYAAIYSYLKNCILDSNVAFTNGSSATSSNYFGSINQNYCCTFPLPTGVGNFTNDPTFVNPAAGDFHLQSNSPCINAGNNNYVGSATDLDDNPRISGGTVDLGAYEVQSPASMLSYVWAQQFGLATDGSADLTDSDGDSMSNWAEWKAGTVPTNAASVLQLTPPVNNGLGLTVGWQSVSGIVYYLQVSTNLSDVPAFVTLQSDLSGQPGTTSYADTTATNDGPYFYRVGVQFP